MTAAVDWTLAACNGADPDLFTVGKSEQPIEAMRLCRRCAIRDGCLETALALDQSADVGVWGGTVPKARVAIRVGRLTRRQAQAAGDRIATRRTAAEIAADPNARVRNRQIAAERVAAAERRKAVRILTEIAADYGLTVRDLTGPSRARRVVEARHEAIRHIVARTGLSLNAVGRLINRDHTSVLYAVKPKATR